MTPSFVTVGHATRDIVPGGFRIGGTVTFAAVQAHRLGMSVGVVTRADATLDIRSELPFAEVVCTPSAESTTFENVYEGGHRKQRVRGRAEPMTRDDIPVEWRSAPIALVGPLLGEVPAELASAFNRFSLVGVSAQGFLRALDDQGNVVRAAWEGESFWRGADVIFVSDEDLDGRTSELDAWTKAGPIVAMTRSHLGARVYSEGRWREMEAFPEEEVDPTGAGDTFATAFLIRLHETEDVADAARFGAAAASLSVGGIGATAMPGREAVEERMSLYPEILLQ